MPREITQKNASKFATFLELFTFGAKKKPVVSIIEIASYLVLLMLGNGYPQK